MAPHNDPPRASMNRQPDSFECLPVRPTGWMAKAAIRVAASGRKKTPYSYARCLLLVISLSLLALASAHSNPITVLKWFVAGVAVVADFGGAAQTLSAIFAGSVLNDDNPLYSTATSSPTLTISATRTSFDLLLQQPNDVSIFEDDFIAELSGTTQVATELGDTNAWGWKISIEANMFGPTTINWDVIGHVQHLLAPHPELGEKPNAPALDYTLTIEQTCGVFTCTNTTQVDSDNDLKTHNDGKHSDQLTEALFELKCCTAPLGFITSDFFKVHLEAIHTDSPTVDIPEPATLILLTFGLAAMGFSRRRVRLGVR